MEALRNIYTVLNNQIIIDLPETFRHKSVEVIILPINEFLKQENKNEKQERLKKLLTVSEWSENDIHTKPLSSY